MFLILVFRLSKGLIFPARIESSAVAKNNEGVKYSPSKTRESSTYSYTPLCKIALFDITTCNLDIPRNYFMFTGKKVKQNKITFERKYEHFSRIFLDSNTNIESRKG